ncbi:hypothetical protein AB0B28_18885 [Glycomyces sp. NPDC046736]|uniref:hypothetical protein n=1 Tax=Glycomyces sp. NPDC046736 TaxID=3155615 RepID=UPI0033E40D1A
MTSQDPYQPHMQPPVQAYPVQPPPVHPHPQYQQPVYQQPYPMAPVWQPAFPQPVVIDGFFVVQPRLKPIPSGPAIGSLVAGISGILGSLPGLIGAAFNPWVGLTFFMFAALVGIGSVSLAVYALRQVKTANGGVSGRAMAITGLVLGIVACSFAALTGLISLASA